MIILCTHFDSDSVVCTHFDCEGDCRTGWSVWSFSNGDRSKNATFKMNSRVFKLCRVYSSSLKLSNAGEFPWSRLPGDRTQVYKEIERGRKIRHAQQTSCFFDVLVAVAVVVAKAPYPLSTTVLLRTTLTEMIISYLHTQFFCTGAATTGFLCTGRLLSKVKSPQFVAAKKFFCADKAIFCCDVSPRRLAAPCRLSCLNLTVVMISSSRITFLIYNFFFS